MQQSNSMLTLYIGITGRIFNRAESPIGLKEGRHIYIKGVTDALVLTVYELRKSILLFHNHLNISIDTSILS